MKLIVGVTHPSINVNLTYVIIFRTLKEMVGTTNATV